MSDPLLTDCDAYRTPNCDIVGIGVRVSVYFQGLFSLILLAFPHADDLVQGSFRNAVLTLYAIGIALPTTPDRHSSVEVKVVLHGFVNILFISALALLSFRPVLRTWRHISVLVGTIGLVFYSGDITIGGIRSPRCGEFDGLRKMTVGSTELPYYVALWAFSLALAILALPAVALLWLPDRLRNIRRGGFAGAIVLWFVTWVMTIVASEASLFTYEFKNRLGFGQIMALVMLFSQVWDIVSYPFKKSQHGGTRIEYWWRTTFKSGYLRTRRPLDLDEKHGEPKRVLTKDIILPELELGQGVALLSQDDQAQEALTEKAGYAKSGTGEV